MFKQKIWQELNHVQEIHCNVVEFKEHETFRAKNIKTLISFQVIGFHGCYFCCSVALYVVVNLRSQHQYDSELEVVNSTGTPLLSPWKHRSYQLQHHPSQKISPFFYYQNSTKQTYLLSGHLSSKAPHLLIIKHAVIKCTHMLSLLVVRQLG